MKDKFNESVTATDTPISQASISQCRERISLELVRYRSVVTPLINDCANLNEVARLLRHSANWDVRIAEHMGDESIIISCKKPH